MRAIHFFVPLITSATAAGPCPFLGPTFPAPKSLATNDVFQASLGSLKSNLQEALTSGASSHGTINPNDTYSIQIFSTRDDKPLLDFHRRGLDVVGNRTLDGDSMYRIASVSKLFTVYLLLLQTGDGIFNDPVTKYVPELDGYAHLDGVTVGTLAGYMSGITAEAYNTDSLVGTTLDILFPGVFPKLEPGEISPCEYGRTGCTRELFLEHISRRRNVHLPNTTPAYTNTAFALLGLILESATGLTYEQGLQKLLVQPLKLEDTTSSIPSDSSRGVIVVDKSTAGWDLILDGAGVGMGTMFSTPNEMTAIGRAILTSSLLPSNTTRAWMKPTSHTSSLIGAVGRGWEIYRAVVGAPENNRVVDLYTKSGNVAGYGAKFVMIPDYDVGFVVMMAGLKGNTADQISGVIVDQLLPALEEAARLEADAAFTGTFVAKGGLNSSITLQSSEGVPGLRIAKWISNGTDLVQTLFQNPAFFQMYPTNIQENSGRKVSWRSSFRTIEDTGTFAACPSWIALDRPTYGVYGLDEFVFDLDEYGKAAAVEPKALKVVLHRL